MPVDLKLYSYDNTYVQVDSDDRGILCEFSDYFSFDVPGAQYMPAYRNKMWDGKHRLFDLRTQRIYKGLVPYIKKFCTDRDYTFELDEDLIDCVQNIDHDSHIKNMNLIHTPFDYQKKAFIDAVNNKRVTFLSPTSSGKSLLIYMITRYLLDESDGDILICVPTIDLVDQLLQEFKDYSPSFDIDSLTHKIYGGQEKVAPKGKRITISTWQSIFRESKSYFSTFKTVMIDEAHGCTGDSLKGILQNAVNAENRFGFTGTLDGLEFHRLIIEGLCGPVNNVTTTKYLMDNNIISKLEIKCMVFKYNVGIRKANKNITYQEEMKFVAEHTPRTKFIGKLCKAIPENKNTLILTAYKNHILELKKHVEAISNKKVYVVTGDTSPEDRVYIRKIAETETGIVIIATYGVYSTGINIKNLQYMIMATGSKSLIRVLQSIGRGLRLDGKENKITIFDIVDDFSWKKKKNYILKHFFARLKIYMSQEFTYTIKTMEI